MTLAACLRVSLVLLPIAAAQSSEPASATCPATPVWRYEPPVTHAAASPTLGLTYVARGSTLYAIWSETVVTPPAHTGGTAKWSWTPSNGPTLSNFPSPVPLSSGSPTAEYIFLGGDDGFLYKIDGSTGQMAGKVDTRRGTCPSDQVIATPSVQLYVYSNSTFKSWVSGTHGPNDDLVFVITRNGATCGGSYDNRIRAYWASNLAPAWSFNDPPVQQMDYGADGCTVDYERNALYCGSEQTVPGLNTLWAVQTTGGAPLWSHDAGPIRNRPHLATGGTSLFVAGGSLVHKRDVLGGGPIWTYSPNGAPIERNIWPEFRSPANDRILVVASDGILHVIEDTGPAPVQPYPPVVPPAPFVSEPVVVPGTGKAFIGRDDGQLQMLDTNSGGLEGTVDVGTAGQPTFLSLDGDRLLASAATATLRLCTPFDPVVGIGGGGTGEAGRTLWQSAPNPFTRETRIDYRLPEPGRVTLTIHGPQGELVRTLVSGQQPAGAQAAAWDGLDERGTALPSGVYFYRLRTATAGRVSEASEKIHLLR